MTTDLVSRVPDGSRLCRKDGRPFFPVIVNYVGHWDRAWEQFKPGQFDAALIEADFHRARQAGANTIRTFVDDPLENEFPHGDWAKLDALVAAAQRAGVYLLLALADYSVSYVQTLARHAELIAARYAGTSVLLGYDLKNEPHFADLAFFHYPQPTPLLDPGLAEVYRSARSRPEALAWARSQAKVPEWFSDEDAVHYAGIAEVWQACLKAASDWITARKFRSTVVGFIRSPEAAPWRAFLDALNATLDAWLTPQLAGVRRADPGRLLMVAWSDPLLAGLPANAALDIIAANLYPNNNTLAAIEYELRVAAELRAAFPGKPLLMTEFGVPTDQLEPSQAAIAESVMWLAGFELGLAGAGKWMLWDLPPGPNARERSFGLFRIDGTPKPSAWALPALAEWLAGARAPRGQLKLAARSAGADISYGYVADDARFYAGQGQTGDAAARWTGTGSGQLFVNASRPGLVRVRATAAGEATLDLHHLLGLMDPVDYTLESGGTPVSHTRDGAVIRFPVSPGQPVICRLVLSAVDARIVILWPHGATDAVAEGGDSGSTPVTESKLANLTAHLTYPGSAMSVPCDFSPEVSLWCAINNEPAVQVATGVRRIAEMNSRRVPIWDFNDVDVSAATDPAIRLYFTLRVGGLPHRSNVWVHGADARTFMPQQLQAEGNLEVACDAIPREIDARIQMLWPHGDAPVSQAQLANLTADLFQHGTRVALVPLVGAIPSRSSAEAGSPRPYWQPAVWLVRAANNGVGERVASGIMRWKPSLADQTGETLARWDFNDVDVSLARDPSAVLHFWIEVEGVRTFSNFWTHGSDARTYLPHPDVLLGDCGTTNLPRSSD